MILDGFEREYIEKRLLYSLAQVLKKEDYEKASEILKSCPDSTILKIATEAVQSIQGEEISQKRYFEMIQHLQKTNGVNVDNSALNNFPLEFLADSENDLILEKIRKSEPTDIVKINYEQDNELIDLWEKGEHKNILVPSDLFWNGTIPLLDCEIEVDERERFFEKENIYGKLITYRVVIFDDFIEKTKTIEQNDTCDIGALIANVPGCTGSIIVPIKIAEGLDCIPTPPRIGFMDLNESQKRILREKMSKATISRMIVSYLETWYGIQIALLHPTVKEVFRKPDKIPITGKRKIKSKAQNRKLKYIKCHVIDDSELKNAIYGTNKTIERKALIWHVIGHWRTYKDGRKVFVKPYWKGKLRDDKRLQETREREVVVSVNPKPN